MRVHRTIGVRFNTLEFKANQIAISHLLALTAAVCLFDVLKSLELQSKVVVYGRDILTAKSRNRNDACIRHGCWNKGYGPLGSEFFSANH
jgi:hypothetical protein